MAKLVDYRPQIGINRGRGLYQAAAIKTNTANKFSQAQEYFADETLKALKEEGEKRGTEEGIAFQFADKEVMVTDENGEKEFINIPLQPEIPDYLGATARKSFEATTNKRLLLKNQSLVESIIGKEYLEAKEKDLSPSVVENTINSLKETYVETLGPKFGELMKDHWDSTVKQKGLGYLGTYGERRKKESKAVLDNETINISNDIKDAATKGLDYPSELIREHADEYKTNGVMTKLQADLFYNKTNGNKNALLGITKTLSKFIGVTNDEINGKDLTTSNELNVNRKRVLSMVNMDGIRPKSVILSSGGEKFVLTQKMVDEFSDNDLSNFETTNDFLKKTVEITSELSKAFQLEVSANKQFERNISNHNNGVGLEYTIKKKDFQDWMDSEKGRSKITHQLNLSLNKGEMPYTSDTVYSNIDAIKKIVRRHGVIPASLVETYQNKIRGLYPKNFTEEDYELLNILHSSGSSQGNFDYQVDWGFSAKVKKLMDEINLTRLGDPDASLTEVLSNVQVNRDTNVREKSRDVYESFYDTSSWKDAGAFSESVHQRLMTELANDPKFGDKLTLGTYFISSLKSKVFNEIETSSIQTLNETQINYHIKNVLASSGIKYKFGRSNAVVGISQTIRKDEDYTTESFVALPSEQIYSMEGESTKNAQTNIQNMLIDRPMNEASRKLFNKTSERVFSDKLGLIPTDYNVLRDHNFARNLDKAFKNEEFDRPVYYVAGWNENKSRWEMLVDEDGNFYITEQDTFRKKLEE